MVIGASGRLPVSMLEGVMPYTILRTNYVQMYEAQDKTGRAFKAVAGEEDEKTA
jgi:hypothetical protein